jgi:hypothetical protein
MPIGRTTTVGLVVGSYTRVSLAASVAQPAGQRCHGNNDGPWSYLV